MRLNIPDTKEVELDSIPLVVNLVARALFELTGIWILSKVMGWRFRKAYAAGIAYNLIRNAQNIYVDLGNLQEQFDNIENEDFHYSEWLK